MHHDTGKHCVFHHRYHIAWSTKYRYKALTGRVRLRVRDILRQFCCENEVDIPRGVLSSRSCPHVRIGAAEDRHSGSGARDEGPFVQKSTTGISRAAQALLGAAGSGAGDIFSPPTEQSPKTLSCDISKTISPILPTPVGSGSVRWH